MAFSAATYGGSNQVWVGNIPYEATEDDLLRLLSSIGPVASIRLVCVFLHLTQGVMMNNWVHTQSVCGQGYGTIERICFLRV